MPFPVLTWQPRPWQPLLTPALTSMAPQDAVERGKGAVPGVPGTAILLMALGGRAITVKSAVGEGWLFASSRARHCYWYRKANNPS